MIDWTETNWKRDIDNYTKETVYRLMHLNWCMFQMGANLPYELEPTEEHKRMMENTIEDFLENINQTPEENHSSWLKFKKEAGWIYGEKKDNEAKTHPCIVPWEYLPHIEQIKSVMSLESVKGVFKALHLI